MRQGKKPRPTQGPRQGLNTDFWFPSSQTKSRWRMLDPGPMSPCHCRCKSVVAASRVSMHAEAHVDGVMDFKRFDAESGRLM